MSETVLSKWAVASEVEVRPGDMDAGRRPTLEALSRWFDQVRGEYLGRCPSLTRGHLVPTVQREQVSPTGSLGTAEGVVVGVTCTELRPSSFELRTRMRSAPGGEIVGTGACSVALMDPMTEEPVPLPEGLRAELIAMEIAASQYA